MRRLGTDTTLVYAHSPGATGEWHPLHSHLLATAARARTLADPFGGGAIAYWLGLWHDLGKFNPDWQAYLRTSYEGGTPSRIPHAVWGAALAYRIIRRSLSDGDVRWQELALPIAGHHAGLQCGGTAALALDEFFRTPPDSLHDLARWAQLLPTPPQPSWPAADPLSRELFIRMVFSALVDADSLDTEQHLDPRRANLRQRPPARLAHLRPRLHAHIARLMQSPADTKVNRVRREVYEACLAAAPGPPGIYRLTVPTGGGKTLSGLAFALAHAEAHGLRRVICAIPYTSIIDQTAAVYRAALGDAAVLEHHSQLEPRDSDQEDTEGFRVRLATENWDAPLIVTTNVQLLESLLGNRRSRSRKLHNIAKSVIVLDEAQTIPPGLLRPTTDVLRALVQDYGATVVLCTATQPALDTTPYLSAFHGIVLREIVPDHARHFPVLRRVRYERFAEPLPAAAVAAAVAGIDQIMVVLNSRRGALAIVDELDGVADVFHLSTLLCSAHRRTVLVGHAASIW